PAPSDVIQRRAQIGSVLADLMTPGATVLGIERLARDSVAWRFFEEALRSEPLYVANQPPDLVIRHANGRHLRTRDAVAMGLEKFPVGTPHPIFTRCEIRAPTAFAANTMAIGTVGLKERCALLNISFGFKRVDLRERSYQRLPCKGGVLLGLRRRYRHQNSKTKCSNSHSLLSLGPQRSE